MSNQNNAEQITEETPAEKYDRLVREAFEKMSPAEQEQYLRVLIRQYNGTDSYFERIKRNK